MQLTFRVRKLLHSVSLAADLLYINVLANFLYLKIDHVKLLGASTKRQEPYKKCFASYMNILVFVEMFCVYF